MIGRTFTLVIGETWPQVLGWMNKTFDQGTVMGNRRVGRIFDGPNEYMTIVATPHDDRIRGMEFDRLIILPGAVDHAGQYSMRVRPRS